MKRHQLSLRTVFVVITVLSCGGAWIHRAMENRSKQRVVIQRIADCGGRPIFESPSIWIGIRYCSGLDCAPQVVGIDFEGTSLLDERCLSYLGHSTDVETLLLNDASVDDSTIAAIVYFPRVRVLTLANTGVSDKSIDLLARLKQLREIDLRGTQILPVGMNRLKLLLTDCKVYYDSPSGMGR